MAAGNEDMSSVRAPVAPVELDRASEDLERVRAEIARTVFGQQRVIDETLITLLAGGHALLVGVPGLAKTRLVETLGRVLGLDAARIQFTPDLLPADILGSEVLEEAEDGRRHFRFIEGPVFSQLLMADEINRASPRTQSALLQAMQEYEVAVAGVRHPLPRPFHVLATQNPIEQEGTYPLPEAQLDRFLLEILVDYPDRATEREILLRTTGPQEDEPRRILDGHRLIALQHLVRRMPTGETVVEAILDLVRGLRPGEDRPEILWGPGPRAGQALMLGVRARALLQGRPAPSLEDVAALAAPALRHRMALHYGAIAEGLRAEDLIARLVAS
ncbi:MAG: MoxR family ATPase [Alphaproteobacteria bacterium]|nr:MAG: MoxR family ATPase [Alphaproteobacteria bacterium]